MTHSFARRNPSPALYPSRSLEAGVMLEAGVSIFYGVCMEGCQKYTSAVRRSLTSFLPNGYIAWSEILDGAK